jgi:hypothetical protein
MNYDEWWSSYVKPASIYTLKETTEDAWEAGIQEGLRRNREWVGLTPVELMDLCVKSYHTDNAGETHFNRGYFADAIESKLKEKNSQ